MQKREIHRLLKQLLEVLSEIESCYFADALVVEYNGRKYLLYAVKVRDTGDPSKWSELAVAIEKVLEKGDVGWSCCPR